MNESTMQKMKQLKFFGMLRAFRTTIESGGMNRYTPDEMTAFLIESEWDERYNRKIQRSLKNAKFRYKAVLEELIYNSTAICKKMRYIVLLSAPLLKINTMYSLPEAQEWEKVILLLQSVTRLALTGIK